MKYVEILEGSTAPAEKNWRFILYSMDTLCSILCSVSCIYANITLTLLNQLSYEVSL